MTDTQLIPLETVTAADLFAGKTDKQLTILVTGIEQEARKLAEGLDVEKKKDRDELASIAYKVARSKTTIDNAGKDFVADLKMQAKLIDERRKATREQLDALRDEIRAPVNRWEENESARIQGYIDAVQEIREMGMMRYEEHELEELEIKRALVEDVDPSNYEEFEERCAEVRLAALATLDSSIQLRKRYDAEQAELAELRREKEERVAREAQERAEREQAERDEQIRREAAEAEQRKAEEQIRQEREARECAERQAREAVERAERAKQEAEESQRREAEERKAEEERRMRNKQHKGKVNREAAEAIESIANVSTVTAKKIVEAIIKGKVPNVTINY